MPDCPTCGRSFDSQRGLGVHHSAAHDELLPNRECARCGVEFHSEHEKTWCRCVPRATGNRSSAASAPNG